MNNKGFAITTILYGIMIIFCLLLVSLLGILSVYNGNLEKLVNDTNGARDKITLPIYNESIYYGRGLYCTGSGVLKNCVYKK